MTAARDLQLAEFERRRDAVEAQEVALLSGVHTDVLLGQLQYARQLLEQADDPFAMRTWELRLKELQRELAIRNVRATRRLAATTLDPQHLDTLEKFVDRHSDRHPETCEAIAAALEVLGYWQTVVVQEDDRG